MAARDIEIIRRAYEAWNRRDYERARDYLDPGVVLDASARVMNPDVYHGHEGFQQLVEEIAEVWDQWRIDPDEFIECDDGVVVVARARARGRLSGVELDEVAYNVWKLRDGKAFRLAFHYDKNEALRDASGRQGSDPIAEREASPQT
jgi:ketosteroid isomerase-like protein